MTWAMRPAPTTPTRTRVGVVAAAGLAGVARTDVSIGALPDPRMPPGLRTTVAWHCSVATEAPVREGRGAAGPGDRGHDPSVSRRAHGLAGRPRAQRARPRGRDRWVFAARPLPARALGDGASRMAGPDRGTGLSGRRVQCFG